MFSSDRDLLTLEPTLFRDISWLAQTLALGTGSLAAGTLTLDDPLLAGTGVASGHIVMVDRMPLEVLAVTDDSTLTVSLLRPDPAGPQIVPANRASANISIVTFAPQRALTHRQLLAMLGIAPNGATPTTIDAVTESQILNPQDLSLVESLGALHLIYSSAAAALSDDSPHAQRARMYQQRFAQERWRARAEVDLNNDALADAVRTLNISHLLRC